MELILAQDTTQLTGEIAKHFPEIIKAAASSDLGIIALFMLIAGSLILTLFRGATEVYRLVAIVIFMIGAGLFSLAFRSASQPEPPAEFTGRVLDSVSSEPVEGARVVIDTGRDQPYTYTNEYGEYRFWIRMPTETQVARIRAEHEAYQASSLPFGREDSQRLTDLFLDPAEPVSVASSSAARVQTATSGPQLSGAGAGWSSWYEVTLPTPPGYTPGDVEYWLTGDRQCNAWAECEQLRAGDSEVAFRFRLQGHSEWPPPGQAPSTGHLRVTFVPRQ